MTATSFLLLAVITASIYGIHRLALWMEARGWIYYKHKHGSSGSLGAAFLEMQSLLEPSKKHVLEISQRDESEEDDAGGSPNPGRSRPHCIHGIATRFCSICNRQTNKPRRSVGRTAVSNLGLSEILQFLNHQQVRATYGAVADVLGVIPLSMGARLGSRRVEASWVVSASTGRPTDYARDEMHPALFREREVISSGAELTRRLKVWQQTRARPDGSDVSGDTT